MLKMYLLPIETAGYGRGPKYFNWRFDPDPPGITGRWAMMDYGFTPYALLVAHDITQTDHDNLILNSDVYAFPDDLDTAVDDPAVDVFFEAINVPTDWLTPATTWRELLRQTAGMFQFNQRYGGIAAEETGTLHSLFDSVTLEDTYNDLTAQEQSWFDQTIVWYEEHLGIEIPDPLPNQKLRQLVKAAGDLWEDQPFYLGGIEF